jgi:hypothetical protein
MQELAAHRVVVQFVMRLRLSANWVSHMAIE